MLELQKLKKTSLDAKALDIDLSQFNFSHQEVQEMFEYLSKLQILASLKFKFKFQNEKDVLCFSEFLSKMQNLKYLKLDLILQYFKYFEKIKSEIAKMNCLEQLSLQVNLNSCVNGTQYFQDCISQSNSLQLLSLNISLIQYDQSKILEVVKEIKKAKDLKVLKLALKLDEYQLNNLPFYQCLFQIWSSLKQVASFYLYCDYLRIDECKFLLSELSKLESLKFVYLSGLNIKLITQMSSFFENLNNKFSLHLDLAKYRKTIYLESEDYDLFSKSLLLLKNLQAIHLNIAYQYGQETQNVTKIFDSLEKSKNLKSITLDISTTSNKYQKYVTNNLLQLKSLNHLNLKKSHALVNQHKKQFYRKLRKLVILSAV